MAQANADAFINGALDMPEIKCETNKKRSGENFTTFSIEVIVSGGVLCPLNTLTFFPLCGLKVSLKCNVSTHSRAGLMP